MNPLVVRSLRRSLLQVPNTRPLANVPNSTQKLNCERQSETSKKAGGGELGTAGSSWEFNHKFIGPGSHLLLGSALALELLPKAVYPNGSLYLVSVYIPLQALAHTH